MLKPPHRSGFRVTARALILAAVASLTSLTSMPGAARADDLAGVVARAREQVESGAYADALKTLQGLPKEGVPAALAVEAGLLQTTATLVVKGADEGRAACVKAVIAAGYDPEVAREQSPKVRAACKAAATEERKQRLDREKVTLSELSVETPEVAWQPVRISATANRVPSWLRVVARVTSSALEGSFDLALAPSLEGPLRGTLDPSWLRPRAKLRVELVAQDKFGDLAAPQKTAEIAVPAAEAIVLLGEVPAGAVVTVDGDEVKPEAGGRVAVSPGSHEIGMALPDGSSAETRVEAVRGGRTTVALSPGKGSTNRTLAWIATGTAVAVGAAGGVLLLTAASSAAEIEELSAKREPGSALPATEYSEIRAKSDDQKTFTTLGTGLLIGAGAMAALSITLWLLPGGLKEASSKKAAAGPRRAAEAGFSLRAGVGPSSLTIAGSF
jgi:hypothetical protein